MSLKQTASQNAVYTPHVAVFEFVEALDGVRVHSMSSDACTYIAGVKELSICLWLLGGKGIIYWKQKASTQIYSSRMYERSLQICKIMGVGFGGSKERSLVSGLCQEPYTPCPV